MDDMMYVASMLGALAVHTDARRWDKLVTLFDAEVRVDYTSLFGGDPQTSSRDQLMNQWRQLLPGFTYTTHVIGVPAITIDRDQAECFASVVATHILRDTGLAGEDYWIVGGCYEVGLHKRNGEWRIISLTLARAWAKGNLDLPRIARERAAEAKT
jgi:hypothetical protein